MRIETLELRDCYDQLLQVLAPKGHVVDWRLAKAVMAQESCFNPLAVSGAGARGLMQLMPETDKWIDKQEDAFDIYGNVKDGIEYLRFCINFWLQRGVSGREGIKFALGSYNAGPGNILQARDEIETTQNPNLWENVVLTLPKVTGARAKETITYVTAVMKYFDEYTGGTNV